MTAANRPSGRPEGGAQGWKVALALVSLALSLLLWLNGLIESLNRPSIGHDLNRRQLELAVLAEPTLNGPFKPFIAGRAPLQTLKEALSKELQEAHEDGASINPTLELEQALVLRRLGNEAQADALLKELVTENGQLAALAKLLREPSDATSSAVRPAERQTLIEGLPRGGLLRLWSCEAIINDQSCNSGSASGQAALQLIGVTVLPVILLLAGIAALLRELWIHWQGRAAEAPPLQGPMLNGVDAVLLIAGGFVVIGELITPLLVSPVLTSLLRILSIASPLREGITVMSLYLALMVGPLVILTLMLRGKGETGRMQFRWQPLSWSLRLALKGFLIVLPVVSLVGWIQGQLWGDPGGSNPLLDLVLNSHNVPALTCFGLTAIVLAPLFEETIFRGALLPAVGAKLGPPAGILLSAAVFAVAHLSLGELLPLLVLGIGLGWLRWRSGRLGSCVLMHGLWNGLTFANLVVLGW